MHSTESLLFPINVRRESKNTNTRLTVDIVLGPSSRPILSSILRIFRNQNWVFTALSCLVLRICQLFFFLCFTLNGQRGIFFSLVNVLDMCVQLDLRLKFLSLSLSLLAPYLDFSWDLHFVSEMCHSPFVLFSLSLPPSLPPPQHPHQFFAKTLHKTTTYCPMLQTGSVSPRRVLWRRESSMGSREEGVQCPATSDDEIIAL